MRHKVVGNGVATLVASVLFCREFANVGVDQSLPQKERELCGILSRV